MAGFNLGDILVNIKANTDGAKQGLSDIQDLGDKTQQMGMSVQKGLNVAAGGLAVVGAGLTLFAKNATNYTEDLVKNSKLLGQQIGVSTTDASRLVAAFGRMGIEAGDAAQMFGIFSKQIVSATQNSQANQLANQKLQIDIQKTKDTVAQTNDEITKNNIAMDANAEKIKNSGDKTGALTAQQALLQDRNKQLQLSLTELNNTLATQNNQLNTSANTFQKLGISTIDASGKQKDFQTLLGEVADKFQAMPDGINKTADAMSLFGRQGKDMIKVLDLGSSGITDLEKQADSLGLTLNQNTIVKINDLIKAQKDLKEQTDAMKISVGTATAPVLASFDRALNHVTASLIGAHSPVKGITTDILAFGGPVASAAGGVLAFTANIDQSLPILRGFVGLLGNPYVLAAVAAAAAVGGLIYMGEKYLSHSRDLGKAFDDQQDQLTGLGAKYGSTVSLLQIFQDRQVDAENAVTAAIAAHKAAIDAIAPSIEVAKQKYDAVTAAQQAVQTSLAQFGAASPQYQAATDNLSNAEYLYNQQLLNNWGLQVNVKTSADNLANARTNLANTTSDLNRVQGMLNNGLDSGVQVIARFGPTANAQIGAIATLQNKLSIVVSTFNGFNSNLQAQVPKINQQLGGISNAIQIYQGQSNTLNASLQNAAAQLQGGKITIQGKRAIGGPVNPGGPYLVGERGPELYIPQAPGRIIPHDMTNNLLDDLMNVGDMLKQFLSNGAAAFLSGPQLSPAFAGNSSQMISTTNIGTINIQDKADADYLLKQLDRNFQLESMGLSPAS